MKLTRLAVASAFLLSAAGAAPVLAGPPDDREIYEMLQRSRMIRSDGMVTKADFVKLMEKRFDAMDKARRGVLSPQEIAKILDPNFANP